MVAVEALHQLFVIPEPLVEIIDARLDPFAKLSILIQLLQDRVGSVPRPPSTCFEVISKLTVMAPGECHAALPPRLGKTRALLSACPFFGICFGVSFRMRPGYRIVRPWGHFMEEEMLSVP